MIQKLQNQIRGTLFFCGQAKLFFYLLIWLMVLLVAGTISEKYIGLYLSQKTYFSSFVIWIGGLIPVPGGYTTLTLIFICLLSKLITEKWTKQKTGTLITHCGALLLLLGGFLTASFSSEGSMVIPEGASSHFVSDYHDSELAIIDGTTNNEVVFSEDQIKENQTLHDPSLPFEITPEKYCENCSITQRPGQLRDGSVHGMLVANEMKPAPLSPDETQNLIGLTLSVKDASKEMDGRYALFIDMPIIQHLEVNGKTYVMTLRHKETALPFDVKLIKFEKQLYPGTDKPRSYQSEVILKDGAVEWHSLISMNNPLRYKGYTLYQSSFIENDQGRTTILAVVKNIGAIFPYVSSLTLCLGLLVHLFLRLPKLKIKNKSSDLVP